MDIKRLPKMGNHMIDCIQEIKKTCSECKGKGFDKWSNTCEECQGRGWIPEEV